MSYEILTKLSDCDVLDVYCKAGDKIAEFREGCDGYYSVILNKEEVGRLIEELQQIHNEMGD